MRNTFRKEDAFTLLDVIVTIAIILALAVGSFVSQSNLIANARQAVTEAAAQTVYDAVGVFKHEKSKTALEAATEFNRTSSAVVVELPGPDCVLATHEKGNTAERGSCGVTPPPITNPEPPAAAPVVRWLSFERAPYEMQSHDLGDGYTATFELDMGDRATIADAPANLGTRFAGSRTAPNSEITTRRDDANEVGHPEETLISKLKVEKNGEAVDDYKLIVTPTRPIPHQAFSGSFWVFGGPFVQGEWDLYEPGSVGSFCGDIFEKGPEVECAPSASDDGLPAFIGTFKPGEGTDVIVDAWHLGATDYEISYAIAIQI